MQRILIVAPNWIGDALMAQPLLARLREKRPGVKVDVPVVFHTVQGSIAGPPLNPGQVQTYDVKTFSGTASFVVS